MTKDELRYILQSYKTAFGTEAGKVVLADLASHCLANRLSVDADPYRTYFNEGKRSVYLKICAILNIVDIDEYLKRYDTEPDEESDEEDSLWKSHSPF